MSFAGGKMCAPHFKTVCSSEAVSVPCDSIDLPAAHSHYQSIVEQREHQDIWYREQAKQVIRENDENIGNIGHMNQETEGTPRQVTESTANTGTDGRTKGHQDR